MATPIRRLLVANRGEIARRIMRSAHAMGISTVAVYAHDDARAPFVREADVAISLQGSTAAETYLDQAKILEAARRTGADALHPGYGFLAENAGFATAVIAAQINWVGPPPAAIAAMGDKLAAKRSMDQAEVATLPSIALQPDADVASAARTIGFPVLVKASAGGGGKGMRIVERESDLIAAIDSARREADSAFGDDTLFLEKWLEGARHIEIQILSDSHGNTIHCFERECSIQRRHQKLIEEAPSPIMTPGLREQMGAAAVSAATAINYVSTGTVEFLVKDQAFWFLEMNTRLQVEHPVTEAITGLDLVREQLRIAQGEALEHSQADLAISGHAIEARLYAEDPCRDFLPSSGRIVAWTPSPAVAARFDSGIETGSTVGINFDPLLAKVIAHAPTRAEAALRLARVLATTRIQGVTTNRDFLVAMLRTPEFLAGETTTDFIDRVAPDRRRLVSAEEMAHACIAVAMAGQCDARANAKVLATLPSGWRNTRMPAQSLRLQHGEIEIGVEYRALRNGSFRLAMNGGEYEARVLSRDADTIELEVDDQHVEAALTRDNDRWLVHTGNGDVEITELPRFPMRALEAVHGGLTAPMPGQVIAVHVAAGDVVEAGQLLLILEAMKMEHRITAPLAGVIREFGVTVGQQVANGELLAVLEATTGDSQ